MGDRVRRDWYWIFPAEYGHFSVETFYGWESIFPTWEEAEEYIAQKGGRLMSIRPDSEKGGEEEQE